MRENFDYTMTLFSLHKFRSRLPDSWHTTKSRRKRLSIFATQPLAGSQFFFTPLMSNPEANIVGKQVRDVPNGHVRSPSPVAGSIDNSIDSAMVITSGISRREGIPVIKVKFLHVLPLPANRHHFSVIKPPRTNPPTTITPEINLLHAIPLHSPTPIVGTPFDAKANKFEYPFPPLGESSAPNDPRPLSSSPRPRAGSQHILSGSPPPHAMKCASPPFSLRKYSPTHPKFRSNVREPPVPPGIVTRRRRISDNATRARSSSIDSSRSRTESDASGNISPMSWSSMLLSSADSSLECSDPSQRLVSELRERKNGREIIGDGAIDLEKRVRINEAEAVDASHRKEMEEAGESTPVQALVGRGECSNQVAP